MSGLLASPEQVIDAYLRSRSEIDALVGERIGPAHPANRDTPWLRHTLIDEIPAGNVPVHHVGARLQFDCYGGNDVDDAQGEADVLSRTVLMVLEEASRSTHDGAAISGITYHGRHRLPDSDFDPARERYVLDVTVWIHPT